MTERYFWSGEYALPVAQQAAQSQAQMANTALAEALRGQIERESWLAQAARAREAERAATQRQQSYLSALTAAQMKEMERRFELEKQQRAADKKNAQISWLLENGFKVDPTQPIEAQYEAGWDKSAEAMNAAQARTGAKLREVEQEAQAELDAFNQKVHQAAATQALSRMSTKEKQQFAGSALVNSPKYQAALDMVRMMPQYQKFENSKLVMDRLNQAQADVQRVNTLVYSLANRGELARMMDAETRDTASRNWIVDSAAKTKPANPNPLPLPPAGGKGSSSGTPKAAPLTVQGWIPQAMQVVGSMANTAYQPTRVLTHNTGSILFGGDIEPWPAIGKAIISTPKPAQNWGNKQISFRGLPPASWISRFAPPITPPANPPATPTATGMTFGPPAPSWISASQAPATAPLGPVNAAQESPSWLNVANEQAPVVPQLAPLSWLPEAASLQPTADW